MEISARPQEAVCAQGRALSEAVCDPGRDWPDQFGSSVRQQSCRALLRLSGCRRLLLPAASARVVDTIAAPTLILQAKDDPFIRLYPETRAKLYANPNIAFVETRHGGHCAYLCRDAGDDIHWAEASLIRDRNQFQSSCMEADWEFEIGAS